jgi:hypothetical protein
MSTPPKDEVLKSEARHLEQVCRFAAECQITAVGFWANLQIWVGGLAAVLAAVSSGSAFADQTILAGSLAIGAAAASAVVASIQPNSRAESHLKAASKYNELRLDAHMLVVLEESMTPAQVQELANRLAKLASASPWYPRRLAKRAQSLIDEGKGYFDNVGLGHPGTPHQTGNRPNQRAGR